MVRAQANREVAERQAALLAAAQVAEQEGGRQSITAPLGKTGSRKLGRVSQLSGRSLLSVTVAGIAATSRYFEFR